MDFDGARMRYLRAGSGPALILLHGLLGYSFSWRYTMPALAPYATVYAPDLLGAGFSDRPRGIDHSMRGTALRVLKFAENLGLESFDLLGTSRGGAVAMSAAAECSMLRRAAAGATAGAGCSGESVFVRTASGWRRFSAPVWARRFFVGATDRMPFLFPYFHARMYGDRNRIPPGSSGGLHRAVGHSRIVRAWAEHCSHLDGRSARTGGAAAKTGDRFPRC